MMQYRIPQLLIAAFAVCFCTAMGPHKPKPVVPAPEGRLVLEMDRLAPVRLELPDQSKRDFGVDFRSQLITRLTNNDRGRKFLVIEKNQPIASKRRAGVRAIEGDVPQYEWDGSLTPAGRIRFDVDRLSFVTGARGDRMFYGFDENFRTRFNSGDPNGPANEFPLRAQSIEPNWFDRHFEPRGDWLTGSQSGLDLGQGFGFDALFAWLKVKYASYEARLNLRLWIDSEFAGRNEYRLIQVRGRGFYFDIAGAYSGYSAGIAVSRTDAMSVAVLRALEGSQDAIIRGVQDLPLVARVDGTVDGYVLLGSGLDANIPKGTRYRTPSGALCEVVQNSSSGSIARVVSGGLADFIIGLTLVESTVQHTAQHGVRAAGAEPVLAVTEAIDLPKRNIPKPDLTGLEPEWSIGDVLKRMLLELPLLPYRIARYFSYDQAFDEAAVVEGSAAEWSREFRLSSAARQIGLTESVPEVPDAHAAIGFRPLIAVVDSGVDYNHPALAEATAGGWDFISGDARPYDDAFHGTQVASLITAVAPHARILALKAFNPWGVTSSAALLGAIRHAVDAGAHGIVLGWSTRHASDALKEGVDYASSKGVFVVTAAGDRGDVLSELAHYPAVLSREVPGLLAVAGVDSRDELVREPGRFSNFGAEFVSLAAPGFKVPVAEPRLGSGELTSTAAAAAITAGVLARSVDPGVERSPEFLSILVQKVRSSARVVPDLSGKVGYGVVQITD